MRKQLCYCRQFKGESKEEKYLEIVTIEVNLQMETKLVFFFPTRWGVLFPHWTGFMCR